ncbi:T-cell surface antigen CD2-like isoform X2 [Polyodon spathula]|uniref:T-cell surface antigen CD2-like isoform X2 n=1 Tax=Polyodon spathula TaxID=7913 RepID=UPI001B7EFC45|nr:T-cell surface antigen CD2-like isoform X2 [Polyodon spathula]
MLAKFRNGNLTTYLDLENRAELFPNGTLKLALINKNDTGHYLLEVFNKEGNNILRESIHLHTQDLICTVAVEKRSRRSRSGQYVVRNNTRREEMKRYTEEQSPPFTKATELEGK